MTLKALRSKLESEAASVSPFLMLGDPTPELCVELARIAVQLGAPMLEIGFPYSDPSADGPAIQRACQRAMAGGTSTDRAFELLARISKTCPGVPLNLLVYGNLAHARGFDRFCADAVAAGASSLLIPDVPLEECAPVREASVKHELGLVHLVAPGTPLDRLQAIDRDATAFLYLTAVQGVTGTDNPTDASVTRQAMVRRVALESDLRSPICVGFGLSTREDIQDVIRSGARIAVIGSHFARAIERGFDNGAGQPEDVLNAFRSAAEPLFHPETV